MIVKNKAVKKALKDRWAELDIKASEIVRDAKDRVPELKITSDRLSKWLSDKAKSGLTETQVVYLCVRWHIPISINIGIPTINGAGEISYVIPKYDELAAITNIKKVFIKKNG